MIFPLGCEELDFHKRTTADAVPQVSCGAAHTVIRRLQKVKNEAIRYTTSLYEIVLLSTKPVRFIHSLAWVCLLKISSAPGNNLFAASHLHLE